MRAFPRVLWLQSPTKTTMGTTEYPFLVTVPVLVTRETDEDYVGLAVDDLVERRYTPVSYWPKKVWTEEKV